ncbi:MAG: peptide MFS transporter [Saprospiraceae bacterium]
MDSNNTAFLGHPKGLFFLFFAELWERFSFYGMRALLTLYMTKQLLFSDDMSFGIYAAYMSLVYVTPVIGGVVADKILGFRRAIILGGVMMAFGHFFLAIESPIFFYSSLALIIVGNGFFKPNISTFVGTLYDKKDPRRDAGFTIFYMGINVGGAVAPLLCAWLAESYGWHYGFGLAGIGMLVGLFYFQRGIGQNVFGENGKLPAPDTFYQKKFGLHQGQQVTLLSILAVPVFALLIRFYEYEHFLIYIVSIAIIAYILYLARTLNATERSRIFVAVYFTFLATLFWAIFEQAGSSLTLFADRNVNLIGINAAQTNSINSTFIILLAVPFSLLWTWLSQRNINPNSAAKFGIGLFLLGVGFVIFGASAQSVDQFAQTPMFYLFFGYFVLTVGELFLSPIGISKMTELSPAKYAAFIMGIWFSSSFFGHYFAGQIAQLTSVEAGQTNVFSTGFWGETVETITGLSAASISTMDEGFQQLYSYVSVYASFGVMLMGIGVIAVLISPIIVRLMAGVK